jgi:hypothetical protein
MISTSATPSFSAEWERIDLLGACLSSSRKGLEISHELTRRLSLVQQQVQQLRQQDPWRKIVAGYRLEPLDQDILTCVLAPEEEPRIGWMYQELQPGIGSSYPTPALIREMFVLDRRESAVFNQRLERGSALMRSGMLLAGGVSPFEPLKPGSRARLEILGRPETEALTIPGAVQVPAHATWQDLVLPQQALRNLREFILWVEHRQQVEQWGARISGGPVALFAGPSGTGKTFAAEVVANAMGRPLFRVDLGLLVSKYIGETEKNLNQLFDAAQDEKIVLLFDEADALFGKRGEVKEARDRYANMEVSHLLSRIERHQGPCILTSNLRQHIDQAFLRRFQMLVDFSRPDAAARTEIWRRHMPAKAPLAAEVDFAQLGREFNLNGGQIRNAALHAAFLAAGSSGVIGAAQIASAVWTELAKKEGETSLASLGSFARYLSPEVTP